VIDGGLFQGEVEKREVMAVPMVFSGGQVFGAGRMLLEEIVARLDVNSEARDALKLNAKDPYDVLIVGGGPAGAAAAVYAARKGIRVGIVAERFGGQLNDTMAIENYISVLETDGPKFALALEAQVQHYGVDVMNLQRVEKMQTSEVNSGQVELHLANGAKSEGAQCDSVHRCPVARNQRAWRAAVSQPWGRLLPALRWATLQRQTCGSDRRRQLRRGGGN
jgi:NADH-dependent peroxiredoxin subunit F